MGKYIVAGNWKMNKLPSETYDFVKSVADATKGAKCEVVCCTPYVCLTEAVRAAKGSHVKIGAENLHFEDKGAFTGEVSADMLKDIGVDYVIIGHSERRQYNAETDETVNLKTKKALEKGLIPIVCVGESLEQREAGITMDLISIQIKKAFAGISAEDAKKVVIAYEPIWAIGTGKTATSEQAEEVCGGIRKVLSELYCEKCAPEFTIQYGGSMKPSNAAELMEKPNIDGGLIGGASLVTDDFAAICSAAK
ncbi:MAG: triose-phosphate isomerase [Firmicutes bacterium]|nr:triose-phosphate isomerase [Bacillota bacterium]HAL63698.1 triose-phosphate isomerase [Clostridiales bacterium]